MNGEAKRDGVYELDQVTEVRPALPVAEPDEVGDFERAADRRAVMKLFTGPVRHEKLSVTLIAKFTGLATLRARIAVHALSETKLELHTSANGGEYGLKRRAGELTTSAVQAPPDPLVTEKGNGVSVKRRNELRLQAMILSLYDGKGSDFAIRVSDVAAVMPQNVGIGQRTTRAGASLRALEEEGEVTSQYESTAGRVGRPCRRFYRVRKEHQ